MGSNDSDPTAGSRPLVGLTAYGERAAYGVWDVPAVLLPASYPDAVLRAGGLPVLLPPRVDAAAAVDRLDAVVLSGGPDIDPARYGEPAHPATGVPRTERDAAELAVLERALAAGIPVLGVCRGAQLLNIGLGGSLRQHLPEVIGHAGHNPSPGVFGTVEVQLTEGSRARAAVGGTARVQCHHHQCLDRLGTDLVVTGLAADGTIEAVELPGPDFVLGVQWHPEQADGEQEPEADDVGLFAALVAAGRRRRDEQRMSRERERV